MPSEFDPHPIIVTEAQCLGIPVVLSDLCGCHGANDVFRDGESGVLYSCGNINGLASALTSLAGDAEKRVQMGNRGRDLAELQSVRNTADNFLCAATEAVEEFGCQKLNL
jgi:glycosyltransferase involved in cell wall biosynthesis